MCVCVLSIDPCSLWHSICLAILEWDICLLPCHCVCVVLISWESWQAFARTRLWLSLSVPAERSNGAQIGWVCRYKASRHCLHKYSRLLEIQFAVVLIEAVLPVWSRIEMILSWGTGMTYSKHQRMIEANFAQLTSRYVLLICRNLWCLWRRVCVFRNGWGAWKVIYCNLVV